MKTLKKNELGIAHLAAILLIILVLAIGGIGWYVWNKNKQTAVTTTVNTTTAAPASTVPSETTIQSKADDTKFLEIDEYDVKVVLSSDIEDAYYVMDPYPYLSVHSLDKYPGCKMSAKDSSGSIAAVSKGKVGDDHFGSPWTEKELKQRSSLKIGDYYYWIELGNGGSCSDPGGNNPDNKELAARQAFSSAKLQKL